MSKQLSVIALVIMGVLLGQGVFTLLDQNTVTVAYSPALFEDIKTPNSEYGLEWEPNFGSGSMSFRHTMRHDETDVSMYVITYLSSEPDSELIRYGRSLVDFEKWKLITFSDTSTHIELATGVSPNIGIVSSKNEHGNLAVMYWYEVGGKPLRSQHMAKLHSITNIFRSREDSSAVVFATNCERECQRAIEVMSVLVTTIFLDPAGRYHGIVVVDGAR